MWTRMTFCSNNTTLCIVTGALGGAVFVVGIIYLYIYCTRIRTMKWEIQNNKKHTEGSQVDLHNIKNERTDGRRGAKIHPFMVVSTVSKINKGGKT